MDLISQLSSQSGDRTEEANRRVAALCLENPKLLVQILEGLTSEDPAVIGDCAEVFTKVAEFNPRVVVPFAGALALLLNHKATRVRWEAMHAIALTAELNADAILQLLNIFTTILHNDSSTIVRDYVIDCLGNVATVSEHAASQVMPIIIEAVTLYGEKHLARALNAMTKVVITAPTHGVELLMYGNDYSNHAKGSVQKAAKKLVKAINKK
ncbi:hypothetical protein EHS13_16255 [Paenibacillus psychroresistens]|uniref:HEAT repeat domain-containing protein n=1 Tax=Paenibacillus psychroresistens TaxID=1778678 RepID=A0A6B8RL30_9BACL|nr:hypothetical protein [Paenibacillus psychroresistens]QGQ96322.1 hypothetical protein EHS13_16255 [Paenibacillus psychroresistens]